MPDSKATKAVVLTSHPYLTSSLNKSRAIFLPPVCDFMAGYKVTFTFYRHVSYNLRSTLSQA
jgi:hypothetical protein